jgi:hypothetical protein
MPIMTLQRHFQKEIRLSHSHLRQFGLFFLVVYLFPIAVHAVIEDIQIGLSQPHEIPLQWNNVREPPIWVDGEIPEANSDWGLYQVKLESDEFVTLWLSEGEWLRIRHPNKDFLADALKVAVSYGTGLYADVPLFSAEQGKSLLLTPDLNTPRLVRITLAPQQDEAVAMALFTSHHKQIPEIAPLYQEIPLSENRVTLQFTYQTTPGSQIPITKMEFGYIEKHAPIKLKVKGPTQLSLESRVIYSPADSVLQQAYRLSVLLNDKIMRFLEFETTVDNRQPISIQGNPVVLGRSEMTSLKIPEGEHELQITSSANLYARLISKTRRHVVHPGYLFPDMNRPPQPERNAIVENQVPQWLNDSAWRFTENELRTLYLTHLDTLESVRHIALRLIRDNSRRDGGLLGAMTMFEAARRRPYEARVRGFAKGLLGRHSFYRNLLPWHKSHNASQTFHKFIAYQLRNPTSENQPLVVAEQHQNAYLKRVAGGYFAPIPASATEPQIYKLPKRTVPSLLRVVVKQQKQPQRQTFFVQFDDKVPVRLQVEPYIFEAPSHYYRYAQGEAGLKMLALSHGTDADTLGGPYASRHSLGSLIDASTLVLPLPPKVEQIKMWQSPPPSSKTKSIEPLQVALQYRAAKRHYRLNETEYLEAASRFESPEALFQHFVTVLQTYNKTSPNFNLTEKNSSDPLASINDTKRDLYNHWLPFIRFLHAQQKHFLETVYRSDQEKHQVLLSQLELDNLITQAQQAETDKQWLVALEKWTKVVQGSQGERHNQAQLAREESLEQLGEVFLAKRLLQGLYIDSADPVLAQKAFEKLLKDYQHWNDKSAQIPLLATAILHKPTATLFKQLIQVLIENGYYDYAMKVGMALPPEQRPHTLMVEQAYLSGWWQTFENILPTLSDKEQRLWLGYRAQDKGDYIAAINFWRDDAGVESQELANALEKGLQIREQLQNQDIPFSKREQVIDDWALWQAKHPGLRHWKTADNLVHDYASAELTYSIDRDLYFYSFIGTPQRSIKLLMPGPLRIRLSVRTLHHKDDIQPVDSWVKIKEQDKLQVLRLNNILPSRGLRIVGQTDKRLGHQTVEEYEFGPGLHEVEIFADKIPIAVKVMVEKPRLPLAVLPPLNKDTLAVALMLHDVHLAESSACQFVSSAYPERGERITSSVEPRSLLDTETTAPDGNTNLTGCSRITPISDCQCTDCVLLIPHCVTFTVYNQYIKREQPYILEHLQRWQARGNSPISLPDKENVSLNNAFSREDLLRDAKIAKYLAARNFEAVLAMPLKESDEDEVIKRMTLLLWIAEQSPKLVQQAVVLGASLINKHPDIPKLRPLWSALKANHHWKSVQSIEYSAGLRFITIQGWQPESPSQRIRKTLLNSVSEQEQIITGHRQMGLSMFNLAETTLEVLLKMDDVAYFRPVPMNVIYWLDEQPHQRLQLTPDKPNQKLRLTVPEGEHIFYVAIEKPVANQFLRLQIKETRKYKSPPLPLYEREEVKKVLYEREEIADIPLITEYERIYHIATPEEPIVANIQGPNWLRIDEWHQGNVIYSRFQEVGEGWHTLTFVPQKGQASALLRLHEMVAVTEQQPEVQLRYFSIEPEVMPDPLVQIYKLPPISRLDVKDAFPLGAQEDGTWSFTGLVQRRRNVEEDEDEFQDFLELRATHRYFDDMNKRHHRTEWFARLFDDYGDVTLGAKRQLRYRLEEHDITLQLAGAAYLQKMWGDGIEWHGLLKGTALQRWTLGEKTFHVPSVSLFGRLLSRYEEPEDDYEARIDNDVFSEYKAEHRFGLTLADKITHRPWLDTLWTGRGALRSNENFFDPDYFSLKGVWKQMLGEGQVDLGYRLVHYWADKDREESVNSHFLSLNLNWNIWRKNQTRWELGAKLQQDLDNHDLLGMLYITWHGSKGRAYRDFMPGEIDFLNLRKRRVPQEHNNEIIRFWE